MLYHWHAMKLYRKEEAIDRIDELARKRKEFLFIVSYDRTEAYVEEVSDIDAAELMFAFSQASNIPQGIVFGDTPVRLSIIPPCRQEYEQSINYIKENQRKGNSYLANLTCKVPIETNLSMRDIFLRSKAAYRCWMKDKFVCFSPEIFVRVQNGRIFSYPMKGTIDATLPQAAEILMLNKKEAAEHATIVDLIRNDLSMVAEGVKVMKYRYVDRLSTHKGAILQTSSEISAILKPYYCEHLGQMIDKLLPAGSITGAPKSKTVEIIHQAEKYERGFYTGVMGYVSDGRLDSAVMIRFIEQEDGKLYYKAGGGITAQSNNDEEYNEIIRKIYVPIY